MDADSEGLAASGRTADSSPDGTPENQQEQPQAQQQQQVPMEGTSAEEGSGGSERRGDESSGSSHGGRPVSASSAEPAVGSLHQEADSDPQTQHQCSSPCHRAQSVQLTSTPSPAASTSAVGGVAMQQQGGCPALMEGAEHGHGPTDDSDAIVDTTPDQLSSTPIQSSTFSSMQKQHQQAVDLTSSINPSPLAAAAASEQQPSESPSHPSPPSGPVPAPPKKQPKANARQARSGSGCTIGGVLASSSDDEVPALHPSAAIDPSVVESAAASLCSARDAIVAGDIGLFVRHMEKLTDVPRLPSDNASVRRFSDSVAAMDESKRNLPTYDLFHFMAQAGRGELDADLHKPSESSLAAGVVALLRDRDNPSHQSAAMSFLERLHQTHYWYGVEWLPLFGVMVDAAVGRGLQPGRVFDITHKVAPTILMDPKAAFEPILPQHIDVVIEAMATSTDLLILSRAFRAISVAFAAARFRARCSTDDLPRSATLQSLCRAVLARPPALRKMAVTLKDPAVEWTVEDVRMCLHTPMVIAECGYSERVAQAGFLPATMSILQNDRLTDEGDSMRGSGVLGNSLHVIEHIINRETYTSCDGLAELMYPLLSRAARQDLRVLGSPANDAIVVLNSLARYGDRQVMSGKAKENPIVERILQLESTLPLTDPSEVGNRTFREALEQLVDLFAKTRRRKLAIDRWVLSQQDPQTAAVRQQNTQSGLVRCLSDKRVLNTIYRLGGPFNFTVKQVAMLAVSCPSLYNVLCPVRSTDRICSYANRELLAPYPKIVVTHDASLMPALARYSCDVALGVSICWKCLATADDIADLVYFLEGADRLLALRLRDVDLQAIPDDDCIRLADAIARLPSLQTLELSNAKMSAAFTHRLATLLKVAQDSKGDISNDSAFPPSSSPHDVTRTPSTSSAALPTGSAGGQRQGMGEGDRENVTKARPFNKLRDLGLPLSSAPLDAFLGLLQGLSRWSLTTLDLRSITVTDSDIGKDSPRDFAAAAKDLFSTVLCRSIAFSFSRGREVRVQRIPAVVILSAGATEPQLQQTLGGMDIYTGLNSNPHRKALKFLHLDASSAATVVEAFLRFAVTELSLLNLSFSSRVPLGELIGGQFLSSGDFASLVHEAVEKANAARESELAGARAVKERQWAADDARLPPPADAAEEDRRMAARQRREERLRAKQKKIRSSSPFILDLSHVPLANASSCPVAVIGVIVEINKKYAYEEPVIRTGALVCLSRSSHLLDVQRRLLVAFASCYDASAPLAWWQTVTSRARCCNFISTACPASPKTPKRIALPKTSQSLDIATVSTSSRPSRTTLPSATSPKRTSTSHAPPSTKPPGCRGSNGPHLTERTRSRRHKQALQEKQKRLAVIENLLSTLQTKVSDLRAQKAAASKADKKDIDRQITSLTEQINRNNAAKGTLLKEIEPLQRAIAGMSPDSHPDDHRIDIDKIKIRLENKRIRLENKGDELRHKHDMMQQKAARMAEKDKKRGDQPPKDDVRAQERLKRAEARARAARKELGVEFSSDDDQQQQHGGGQEGGEGGKKAKKKKRRKNKTPSNAPAALSGPLPSAAAGPSLPADSSPSVREGEGEERDDGLEPARLLAAVAAGSAAAVSAASGPLLPLTTASMPPLPGGGREVDDLLSIDGASGHGGGGDWRLTGQGAEETDGRAAGRRDDGRVSGGDETEALRARIAELEAELMRRDRQSEASRHESMEREAALQQQFHALQQETHAARQEIERLREAQAAGEQTVADTLAANERLQADMKKANEVYRQQLSQQHQRLTSAIDRERSARQQQVTEMQRHIEQAKRAAAQRETSLRQENTSLRQETASQGQEIASLQASVGSLQADIDQLRSNHIDRLSETFQGLTTADDLSGFAMQLIDRQTAITTTELPQLQSLIARAQQRAHERQQAEFREQMQRQMEERTDCQVCLAQERSVVLQPCGHFCVCQQCVQNLQPPECPLCRQPFDGWTNAILS
ncbi:unnamed protein product [Vitrella brassicaformis CCMP3155]|uniref:RING-type domain-containing protein n=1 Tax=Vitrella brassicaformis (strain CCMP3155) TaxID=1169540 RepID=A0A0G4FL69_VITBC|nr:unnamed protein product [Vitrella brassicaformis CCMP3155]|eukprot:CEM14731.1 unnamed protein product [Vitrella brassicaformis CCMP3155]